MDRRKQLDHWKRLFEYVDKREEEIGMALMGERIYIFETLNLIEEAVYDLYSLDSSDWNDGLIVDYIFGNIDYETFESFIVRKGESYDGLRAQSNSKGSHYWREPVVVVDNRSEEHTSELQSR